jgi:hypothetical protein
MKVGAGVGGVGMRNEGIRVSWTGMVRVIIRILA